MEVHLHYRFQFISREIPREMRKKQWTRLAWRLGLVMHLTGPGHEKKIHLCRQSEFHLRNEGWMSELPYIPANTDAEGFYHVFSILPADETTSVLWKNLFPARIQNNLGNYGFNKITQHNRTVWGMHPVFFSPYLFQHSIFRYGSLTPLKNL